MFSILVVNRVIRVGVCVCFCMYLDVVSKLCHRNHLMVSGDTAGMWPVNSTPLCVRVCKHCLN